VTEPTEVGGPVSPPCAALQRLRQQTPARSGLHSQGDLKGDLVKVPGLGHK
jgi:hypothetical protein